MFAKQVREHAAKNYNVSGWDYVVECWEDSHIDESTKDAKTPEEAIAMVGKIIGAVDEQRQEVRAEIF